MLIFNEATSTKMERGANNTKKRSEKGVGGPRRPRARSTKGRERWLLVLCWDGLTFTLFNVMDSFRSGQTGATNVKHWWWKCGTSTAAPTFSRPLSLPSSHIYISYISVSPSFLVRSPSKDRISLSLYVFVFLFLARCSEPTSRA